jgi:hypothetical protein
VQDVHHVLNDFRFIAVFLASQRAIELSIAEGEFAAFSVRTPFPKRVVSWRSQISARRIIPRISGRRILLI